MDTKKLKQKVLDLAIRGKLVPQDPNDEPASKLLERIYAEKQKLISEGKIKKEKRTSFIFKGEDNSYYEKVEENGKETIRDITAEIPFDIPPNWTWSRLGSVGEYKKGPFGSSITKSMFVKDDGKSFKVYEQKNAIYKNETLGNYFISKEKYDQLQSFKVKANDIIVSCAGTIGETYVLPRNTREGIINQALMRIRLYLIEITDFYLLYFDYVLKNMAKNDGKGTAIKNIPPLSLLKESLIPIPPLNEQVNIIERINRFLLRISSINNNCLFLCNKITLTKSKLLDLAIRGKLLPQNPNDEPASVLLERIRKEQESTKTKRKSVGSYIFKGGDNLYYEQIGSETKCIQDEIPFDIPNSWAWTRLGSVCTLNDGEYASNQKLPYLEAKYLRGKIEATIQTDGKFVKKGETLILVDGENSGEIFDVSENGYQGSTFKILTIVNATCKEYVYRFIAKNKELFKGSKKGSAIPHLNRKIFQELLLPLPPKEEQERINEFLTSAFYQLDSLIQH